MILFSLLWYDEYLLPFITNEQQYEQKTQMAQQ